MLLVYRISLLIAECMRIHILGSGAYPLRFTNGKSLCIFFPDHNLLLDAGLGIASLPATAKGEELRIILSHFHHDHILGLAFLVNILEDRQFAKVRIMGDERISHLQSFFEEPFSPTYQNAQLPISLVAIGEQTVVGNLTITRRQVPHASGFSNLLVFDDGTGRLGISTDTMADVANAPFFQGCDMLLHECNYSNAKAERAKFEGHSYPAIVAALAKATGVPKLGLIHTDPRHPETLTEIQAEFPGAWVTKDDDTFAVRPGA